MKSMNNNFIIIIIFLLILQQLVYALDPSNDVRCCWDLRDNKQIDISCNYLNEEKCQSVLADWEKTEKAWIQLNSPSSIVPLFIIGGIIIFSILIWYFIKRKSKKK